MQHKLLFVALAAALLTAACQNKSFTISGTIEGGAGQKLFLEELTPDGPLFIDSIPIDAKGHYKYRYTMPYRSMYNLHTTADNYAVTLPDYGEHMVLDGRWDNLSLTYTVKGSPESTLLWQLQQYINDGAQVLNALVDTTQHYAELLFAGSVDEATVLEKKAMTDSLFLEEYHAQQDYATSFVQENAGSLATLIALYMNFNNRPLIDPRMESSVDYYETVLNGLEERYPDNPHTQHFKISVERMRSRVNNQ